MSWGNFIKNTVSSATKAVTSTVEDAAEAVVDTAKKAKETVDSATSSAVDFAEDSFEHASETADKLADAGAKQVKSTGKEMIGAGKEALKDIKETAVTVGDLMQDTQRDLAEQGIKTLKDGVEIYQDVDQRIDQARGEMIDRAGDLAGKGLDAVKDGVDVAMDGISKAEKARRGFNDGVDKLGRAAFDHVVDVAMEESKRVGDVIVELKDSSVEDLMDRGWEAAGFSKGERELLKTGLTKVMDQSREAVGEALRETIERQLPVSVETLDQVLKELSPAYEVLTHQEGLSGVINDRIGTLQEKALTLAPLLADKLPGDSEFKTAVAELREQFDEVNDSLLLDLLKAESSGLGSAVGLISESLSKSISLLELAAEIPDLAQSIQEHPEEFLAATDLMRPETIIKSVQNLEVGQAQEFSFKGDFLIPELFMGGSGDASVTFERTGKDTTTINIKSGLGVHAGTEIDGKGFKGGRKAGVEIEAEFSGPRAAMDMMKVFQLSLNNPEALSLSDLESAKIKSLLSSSDGEAALTLYQKTLAAGGVNVASFGAEAKVMIGSKVGVKEVNGKMGAFLSATSSLEGSVGVKTEPFSLSLPDSPQSGAVSSMIDLLSAEHRELIGDAISMNDSSASLKATAQSSQSLHVALDGTVSGERSTKVVVGATPFDLEIENKVEIKDAMALARALGKSKDELVAGLQSGSIDLIELAKSMKDALIPTVIDVTTQVDVVGYDNVGAAFSSDLASGEATSKTSFKETILKFRLGEDVLPKSKSIMQKLEDVAKKRQALDLLSRLTTPPEPKEMSVWQLVGRVSVS